MGRHCTIREKSRFFDNPRRGVNSVKYGDRQHPNDYKDAVTDWIIIVGVQRVKLTGTIISTRF